MTSLQERLFAMQDKQYAAFQAKLTPGVPVESFIGIRVPVLRKFAKEFTKEADFVSFLYLCTQIRQRNKRNKKNPIRNETLYAHNITIIRSELSKL